MFYDLQPNERKEMYKEMLKKIGNLSLLFSESTCPYLPYRAHENVFCRYLQADNLSRLDCSIDAKKDGIGIGLKTWMGSNDQKIAEFGKLREVYKDLSCLNLIKAISFYRNERIKVTKRMFKIDTIIYHIVKRVDKNMMIYEKILDDINCDNLEIINGRGNNNNIYFTDGKNTYHFSLSKNTLYMIFDGMEYMDKIEVEIFDDPYTYLMSISDEDKNIPYYEDENSGNSKRSICLRLYSKKADGSKHVYKKSGLNQWNASGRKRDPNEIYIQYPSEDRIRNVDFFPSPNKVFNLKLPDGTIIPAKVCQSDGKAIMSNPNKILGKWLLRDVFGLTEGTILTYQMLEQFGVDCVIFTKDSDLDYSIDFANIGTYESFYSLCNL